MINYAYCQSMFDYIECNDVDMLIIIQQVYEAGYIDGQNKITKECTDD